MGRRRKASGSGLRGTLLVLGGVSVAVWIASLVGAIAERINGARNPLIPAIGLGMMILGLLIVAVWISHLYRRRKRTKQRQFMELLALTPTQFEHVMAHLLHDLGYRHVRHVWKSPELCADLTAMTPGGQRGRIQCQRRATGGQSQATRIPGLHLLLAPS